MLPQTTQCGLVPNRTRRVRFGTNHPIKIRGKKRLSLIFSTKVNEKARNGAGQKEPFKALKEQLRL